MYYKYFIDFLGTLTILYAKIHTDADPAIMALIYFAMIYIGKGITHGFFSPLAVFVQYSLGRMNTTEAMYYFNFYSNKDFHTTIYIITNEYLYLDS